MIDRHHVYQLASAHTLCLTNLLKNIPLLGGRRILQLARLLSTPARNFFKPGSDSTASNPPLLPGPAAAPPGRRRQQRRAFYWVLKSRQPLKPKNVTKLLQGAPNLWRTRLYGLHIPVREARRALTQRTLATPLQVTERGLHKKAPLTRGL